MRGFSFSWKRFIGITTAKQQFARTTGFPLPKAVWNEKLAIALSRHCLVVVIQKRTSGIGKKMLLNYFK